MQAISQTAPLTAVMMGVGCAENSSSILCQARAVHRRKPFHADKVNTSQYSRVTRMGSLFIVCVCRGAKSQMVENAFETELGQGAVASFFGRMHKLKAWLMPVEQKHAQDETSPNIFVFREDT